MTSLLLFFTRPFLSSHTFFPPSPLNQQQQQQQSINRACQRVWWAKRVNDPPCRTYKRTSLSIHRFRALQCHLSSSSTLTSSILPPPSVKLSQASVFFLISYPSSLSLPPSSTHKDDTPQDCLLGRRRCPGLHCPDEQRRCCPCQDRQATITPDCPLGKRCERCPFAHQERC